MAQLVVRNLSDTVKEKLRRQARTNGHSMEEEARRILQKGVATASGQATPKEEEGWATKIQQRFAAIGLTAEEADDFDRSLEELRKAPVRTVDLE